MALRQTLARVVASTNSFKPIKDCGIIDCHEHKLRDFPKRCLLVKMFICGFLSGTIVYVIWNLYIRFHWNKCFSLPAKSEKNSAPPPKIV